MPKITEEMIRPELRKRARLLKKGTGKYSLLKTKLMKKLCRLLRGKHNKKMRYKQVFLTRPDGSKLRICVYTPLERKENVPGLLWMHGGGYAIGIPEQDDSYIFDFIEANGCIVVSPDYTLSLDKPYPAALDDCYTALLWLRDNGESYGMRPDQIFVGGNSAGGGLAAAISLYARDRGEVSIAFQMPLYPMLDDRPTGSSTDNNDPVWSSAANVASWKLYLGDLYDNPDVPIYAAPARAEDLSGLPPVCSFVGDIEPFYDENIEFFNRMKTRGVHVDFKVFNGCYHAFDQMCRESDVSKEAKNFLLDRFLFAADNYYSPQKKD